MLEQHDNVLLNWLFSGSCETYQHSSCVLYRYQESDYLNDLQAHLPYRCRVILILPAQLRLRLG